MATLHNESLSERINNVMQEIEAIKAELRSPSADPSTGLAIPKAPISVINELKYAADQLRFFLWAYLDTWARGGSHPEERMQQIRAAAAADMLRLLAKDFHERGVPTSVEVARLREQIRVVSSTLSEAA